LEELLLDEFELEFELELFDEFEDELFDEFEDELFDEFELELLDELFDELFDEFDDELFDEFDDELFDEFDDELFDEFDDVLELVLLDEFEPEPEDRIVPPAPATAGCGDAGPAAAGSVVASTTLHQILPWPSAMPTPTHWNCGSRRLSR
jgi:hypothetical protein